MPVIYTDPGKWIEDEHWRINGGYGKPQPHPWEAALAEARKTARLARKEGRKLGSYSSLMPIPPKSPEQKRQERAAMIVGAILGIGLLVIRIL